MTRWAGYFLIGFSLFHLFMTGVLFIGGLEKIAEAGAFGGLQWDMEAHTAFWFALLTWPLLLLGILVVSAVRQLGYLPGKNKLGWGLIVGPILCGIILPTSGLWAFILPGLLLLWDKTEV